MSNLLTYSRLRSYRACARKHHYRYELGYVPLIQSEALRFGSLIHKGLEAWWLALQSPETRLTAALAAVAVESDPFDRVRAEELLIAYEVVYGEETAATYDVLGVEVQFTAPLINPETGKPSRTWLLGGKDDAIAQHRASGRVLIVEHKTTADAIDTDEDGYWQRLALDHQLSGYVVGAEALGYAIDECLYDAIRKPGIRPLQATPPESRKYVKATNALYANQRDHDETPEEYRARLREDIQSRPARYFQRRIVPRMQSQIDEYLFDVWSLGRSIREAEIAKRAPRNPEECLRMGRCEYWNVCTSAHDITTSAYFKRTDDVHPELSFPDITAKEETLEPQHSA